MLNQKLGNKFRKRNLKVQYQYFSPASESSCHSHFEEKLEDFRQAREKFSAEDFDRDIGKSYKFKDDPKNGTKYDLELYFAILKRI